MEIKTHRSTFIRRTKKIIVALLTKKTEQIGNLG